MLGVGAAAAETRQHVAQWRDRAEAGVRAARANQALLQRLQQARIAGALSFNNEAAARLYQQAFRDYGMPVLDRDPAQVAAALQTAPTSVQPALLAALDDWSLQTPHHLAGARLRQVARRADPDPWRQRLREALDQGDLPALQRLSKDGDTQEQPPVNIVLLAHALMRYQDWDDAIGLLRQAQASHPEDLWIHAQLGFALTRGK